MRMNICIDNDNSRGGSNSSTCNILSCRTFLIWVGIVTSEAFSLTEMIWFRHCSSLITVDDIESRAKRNTQSYPQNSLYFYPKNELFISTCNAVFTIFKQSSYLFVPSYYLFCFSRKVTGKYLPLVSCFVKSNFCWQSAKVQLPYHLGSIYSKLLALIAVFIRRIRRLNRLCNFSVCQKKKVELLQTTWTIHNSVLISHTDLIVWVWSFS